MNNSAPRINTIVPYLVLGLLSAVPLLFSYGKLNIGGDIMIPFNSEALGKYLHQWTDVQNGQYFSHNLFPYFFLYKLLEFFGIGIYQISSLILFLLNFIAGIGVIKVTSLFTKKHSIISFSVLFYLFSPALLNSWHYLFVYSLLPLFFFFVLKWLRSGDIPLKDTLYMSLLVFFLSTELPNPKYLFYLFVVFFLTLSGGLLLKIINLSFFRKNWKGLLIIALLSTYLILPLAGFAKNYSPDTYGTKVRANYKDTGKFMDEGSATLDKMFRFHSDGLVINILNQERYKSNAAITLLSFVFILFITTSIAKKHPLKKKSFILLLVSLILIYLLFSVGPNRPFGFFYKSLISNLSIFAFLRTTAGAVFFLSLFAIIIISILLEELKTSQRRVLLFMTFSLVLVSYPIFNGEFYENVNAVNPLTNTSEHGYKIPPHYFKARSFLDKKRLIGKILFPKSKLSYLSTDWGYFGPMFYNFLFKQTPIYQDGIGYFLQFHNVSFLIKDLSATNNFDDLASFSEENVIEIKEAGFLRVNAISKNTFLPILYSPQMVQISDRSFDSLKKITSRPDWKIRSAIFFESQNVDKEELLSRMQNQSDKLGENLPTLEFKKINPTKYRIRVHGAQVEFPLVFSESFHEGWKAYLVNQGVDSRLRGNDNISLDNYKILDGNEEDQASISELKEYIQKCWVTDLGDEKEREIEHQKWNEDKQKEELDYVEKYNIDFVSKNFQGTIQNDNLPKGYFWETWFQEPIENNENHLMANGYANSWVIDPKNICQNSSRCIKNPDGSYDFELVVEFWPQRLFYIGVGISGITLLGCLIYLSYDWKRNRDKIRLGKNDQQTS